MTGLARATATGVFWSYLSFLGTKGINLVAMVVLARLLGPQTFGLMALCLVVMAYFEIVARFGLGAALISAPADRPGMETAVAVMSLLSAGAMVALAWGLAAPLARAFDAPDLVWPLRLIALGLMIDAAAVVPATLLSKRLQFRRKALPDLARSLVKAGVSIGLALAGLGIDALVWGHVLGTAAGAAAAWAAAPWRPRAAPAPGDLRAAFRFGHPLLLAEAINAAQRNLDALLVGHLLGPAALGLYSLAFRMPDLLIRSFNQVAGGVLHPVIAARAGAGDALATLYLTSLRHVALVTFPAGVALAASAGPVVRLLYTPQWDGMIQPMTWLALALALQTVDFVPGILYKAMNRTDHLLWTSALKLPVFVTVLVLAAPHGLAVIAAAQVGLALVWILPNALILRRRIGVGLGRTLAALGPAVALAAAVGAAGLAVNALAARGTALASDGAHLAALLAACGAAYLPGLALALPELRGPVARRLRRGR